MLTGECDGLLAGPGIVTDGRDDLQVGSEGTETDLETNLVVALAGAAVRDDGPAVLTSGLHDVLDDQRAADGGHQRVAVHVQSVGLHGRQAVLGCELVLGIDDDGFDSAAVEGALTDDLHVLAALAEIDGDGDDLLAGLLADPTDGNGGVQPARVGEYDAIGHGDCAPSYF